MLNTMSSEEATAKKVKKEKKSKSRKAEVEQDAEVEAATAIVGDEEVKSKDKKDKSKKRKREELPEELEIDVSLPEPPSKKALRKSKKSKTAVPTATSNHAGDNDDAIAEPKDDSSKPTKEEKERRTDHSIWIGNLPWTATKQDLRDFLLDQGSIQASQITRVHMPAPSAQQAKDTKGRPAFKNKGFAYVDFDSQETLFSALQLTETPFYRSGRNVLVKNARSFEGRPEDHVNAAKDESGKSRGKGFAEEKPPSKRIFVGNLAFEITKEDLETYFGQCGAIENIHMATFEDSGKCKGYGWITFATLEAAESAVKGFILKEQDEDEDLEGGQEDAEGDEAEKKPKVLRKKKPRKWFVNRLFGREIKREYAEDASVRYKKRFGSDRKRQEGDAGFAGDEGAPIREVNGDEGNKPYQKNMSSHDRRREQRRAQKYGNDYKKVDARTVAPGAALSHAQRGSTAISTEKTGTKIRFD